ncbi:hypothetical protein BT69DRAFT_1236464, partial [Atractiella rhizophila]
MGSLMGSKPSKTSMESLKSAVRPLPSINSPNFASFIDSFSSSRIVLLGEASHGTSEFYTARAAITRRLIEKHGFSIVATEADWPDAASIDRYVRLKVGKGDSATGKGLRERAEPPFSRFPTWMWRNEEVAEFAEWVRRRNTGVGDDERVRWAGLDLYSLNASIRAVIDYLDEHDPDSAAQARKQYGCLAPYVHEPQYYGLAVRSKKHSFCESGVVQVLKDLLSARLRFN